MWGPVGYSVKFRFTRYEDAFTGPGGNWLDGGVAQETYTALEGGVTAAF